MEFAIRSELELGLLVRTPPEWAERVLAEPRALLSDHAQCELGAAASAQALIQHHPERSGLCERLARLAVEELEHFRTVLQLLHSIGGRLERSATNRYVTRLAQGARATRGSGPQLLDRLLVAGLIEARSHERFCLLGAAAERLDQPALAALYRELGPSERGHAALFVRHAAEIFGARAAEERLGALRKVEAGLVAELPFAPRVHSGWGAPAADPGP
jgi:tRNA 2-(methylsulfanyl)-N6-isopentenyladenosine37 hydroxylase